VLAIVVVDGVVGLLSRCCSWCFGDGRVLSIPPIVHMSSRAVHTSCLRV